MNDFGPIPQEIRGALLVMESVGASCAARVAFARGRVMYSSVRGYLDASMARQLCLANQKIFAECEGAIKTFLDYEEMTGYHADARNVLTEMVLQHRDRFLEMLVLTRSTAVALGVGTAGLVTALVGVPLRGTRDREEFLRALARA